MSGIKRFLADPVGFTPGYRGRRVEGESSFATSTEQSYDELSTTSTTRPNLSARYSMNSTSSSVDQSNSEIWSEAASVMTDATSATPPPNLRPPWHRDDSTSYDYSLPCEFKFLGCELNFPAERWEDWIAHSRSHFTGVAPPPKTVCVFSCSSPPITFEHSNPSSNWRFRMIHIGQHHMDGIRGWSPDYFILEYLHRCELLSGKDFEYLMEYTERPVCDGLVPSNYKSKEMRAREARERRRLVVKIDPAKEDRERRREARRRRLDQEVNKACLR